MRMPPVRTTDGPVAGDALVSRSQAWIHGHHLFNGMSGHLYPRRRLRRKLQSFLQRPLNEKLRFIQQITPVPNLMSGAHGPNPVFVNGVSNKSLQITMQPGEIQLWRIVNAMAGGGSGKLTFQFTPVSPGTSAIVYKQIAQDGVQFCWENFANPQNGAQPIVMMPAKPGRSAGAGANYCRLLYYNVGTLPQGRGRWLTLVVTAVR